MILAFTLTFNNLQAVDKDFCMLGAGEYRSKSDIAPGPLRIYSLGREPEYK